MKAPAFVLALAAAALFTAQAQNGQPAMSGMPGMAPAPAAPTPQQLAAMAQQARRLGLPEGVIQITPCVPGMGEHWADPGNLPFGPIYGVMNGKVVFVEIMVDQKDFLAGKSWDDQLKPPGGQRVDHVNIGFNPHGHEGYPVPHYDLHAYFVPFAEQSHYCLPK